MNDDEIFSTLSIDELIEIVENAPESDQAELDEICREVLPDSLRLLFEFAYDPQYPSDIRAGAAEGLAKHGLLGKGSDQLH